VHITIWNDAAHFLFIQGHQPTHASSIYCGASEERIQEIGQNNAICRDDETTRKPYSVVIGGMAIEIRCDNFCSGVLCLPAGVWILTFIFGQLQLSQVYLRRGN